MRFCPWYPLAEAARHAPSGRGVLQVRAPALRRYPTGLSAMIHYELADDVRAAATRYAAAHPGEWLCRHTIEMTDADRDALDGFHARLVREFRARFGDAPRPG